MGDHIELQVTPETPGRPSIRNPFESPNDYRHLREPLVPSPSVFKSKPCKATPPKFHWSIDEMASLLPAHIDPEEIQRQSFYLSQTRTDSDIEEKRQHAIDQFFTKGAIVPSPWAAANARKAPLFKKSSPSAVISEEPEKHSVACQTTLSLPLAFDLEKLLGEYYRNEEACDAVQESLSSSSLRRKLFLDGHGSYSGSDSSGPPSPERGPTTQIDQRREAEGFGGEVVSSIFSSPLPCGVLAPTPSTGQFSSSPIQHGCLRDCSLGSIASPLFPDRSSPAGLASPTISPIVATRTPIGSAERKQPCGTPNGVTLDMDVPSCAESPFVEGCSPIRSYSPHQPHCHSELQLNPRSKPRARLRCWASPPPISPILNPKIQDNHETDDQPPQSSSSSSSSSSSHPPMELDSPPPLARVACPADATHVGSGLQEIVDTEKGEEAERMEGRLEVEEEDVEDEGLETGGPSEQLTSSRMGNVSAIESSQMFMSLLAEGSSIRYDSSMQVDSGYNTTSAGAASLIDGFGSECHSKESFSSNLAEEAFQLARHSRMKVLHPHY